MKINEILLRNKLIILILIIIFVLERGQINLFRDSEMWKHKIIEEDNKCNKKYRHPDLINYINFHIDTISQISYIPDNLKQPFEKILLTCNIDSVYNRKTRFAVTSECFGSSDTLILTAFYHLHEPFNNPVEWTSIPDNVVLSLKYKRIDHYGEKVFNVYDIGHFLSSFPFDDDSENFNFDHMKLAATCIIYLLSVLSCKNVVTKEILPPEKVNKKRLKNGKLPLYSYHVLNVDLSHGRKKIIGGSEKSDSHQRIHFQRGHFKQYAEQNKLFGKHTGLYWWQPHLRGTNKDGFVDKDYNIKTE